jgi:hypothetical protein
MRRIISNLGILVLTAAFTTQVRSNPKTSTSTCTCPSSLRDPQDPTNLSWTTYWESDFAKMTSAQDLSGSFRFKATAVDHPSTTGAAPMEREFDEDNVAVDVGRGLQLTVSPVDGSGGAAVKSGGVYTQR